MNEPKTGDLSHGYRFSEAGCLDCAASRHLDRDGLCGYCAEHVDTSKADEMEHNGETIRIDGFRVHYFEGE